MKENSNTITLQRTTVYRTGAAVAVLFLFVLFYSQRSSSRDASTSFTSSFINTPGSVTLMSGDIPFESVRRCTPEQAKFQGENKPAARVYGCPSDDDFFMRLVQLLNPDATTFVDIGSNKGYTASRFFMLWQPELGFTPKVLYDGLMQVATSEQSRSCGVCKDCKEDTLAFSNIKQRLCSEEARIPDSSRNKASLEASSEKVCFHLSKAVKPIKVLSFDGNHQLISDVTKAAEKVNPSLLTQWSLKATAFSDEYAVGKTLTFVEDDELGHIKESSDQSVTSANANNIGIRPQAKLSVVPVLTVDQLIIEYKLNHIDLLKIDTEGHDVVVLEGAKQTLASGKVTVVLFEYNGYWPKQYKGRGFDSILKGLVTDLQESKFEYICYFEGKNVLARLSFCWHSNWANRQWSNVWCVNGKSAIGRTIVEAFDKYSLAFLY